MGEFRLHGGFNQDVKRESDRQSEAERLSKDLDALSAVLFYEERRDDSDVIQDAMDTLSALQAQVTEEREWRERLQVSEEREHDRAEALQAQVEEGWAIAERFEMRLGESQRREAALRNFAQWSARHSSDHLARQYANQALSEQSESEPMATHDGPDAALRIIEAEQSESADV